MKNMMKDGKRSALIQDLQNEVESQDKILDILTNSVGEDKVANIIQAAMSRGPKRTRFKSRIEFKFDVKNLNKQVTQLKDKLQKDYPIKIINMSFFARFRINRV